MTKNLKKLEIATLRLIRVKIFLNECGLSRYFNSVGEIRKIAEEWLRVKKSS